MHWIVIEPTRGASFQVNVEHGQYPPDALATRFPREAKEWIANTAHLSEGHTGPSCSFQEWLEREGYTVHLCE
jgi:hypothetical protein